MYAVPSGCLQTQQVVFRGTHRQVNERAKKELLFPLHIQSMRQRKSYGYLEKELREKGKG
jgi:hypothetical protein